MKTIFKLILPIFVALLICVPLVGVKAEAIRTLNVSESNGQITVSGTTNDGILAVAIQVYDSTGSTLLNMKTTSVSGTNTYSDTISMQSGTYVIRVANYAGGDFISKTVKENTTTSEVIDNPKTFDSLLYSIILGIISVGSIITCVYILKKTNISSK